MKSALSASLATAVLLVSAGSIAWAATPADTVKARQANFKQIGRANKALRDELAKPTPSLAVLRASAADLQKASAHVVHHFPKGSGPESGATTKALPAIWQRNAEFRQRATAFTNATGALLKATRGTNVAAIQTAYKAVPGTCKACHDSFRAQD